VLNAQRPHELCSSPHGACTKRWKANRDIAGTTFHDNEADLHVSRTLWQLKVHTLHSSFLAQAPSTALPIMLRRSVWSAGLSTVSHFSRGGLPLSSFQGSDNSNVKAASGSGAGTFSCNSLRHAGAERLHANMNVLALCIGHPTFFAVMVVHVTAKPAEEKSLSMVMKSCDG